MLSNEQLRERLEEAGNVDRLIENGLVPSDLADNQVAAALATLIKYKHDYDFFLWEVTDLLWRKGVYIVDHGE